MAPVQSAPPTTHTVSEHPIKHPNHTCTYSKYPNHFSPLLLIHLSVRQINGQALDRDLQERGRVSASPPPLSNSGLDLFHNDTVNLTVSIPVTNTIRRDVMVVCPRPKEAGAYIPIPATTKETLERFTYMLCLLIRSSQNSSCAMLCRRRSRCTLYVLSLIHI